MSEAPLDRMRLVMPGATRAIAVDRCATLEWVRAFLDYAAITLPYPALPEGISPLDDTADGVRVRARRDTATAQLANLIGNTVGLKHVNLIPYTPADLTLALAGSPSVPPTAVVGYDWTHAGASPVWAQDYTGWDWARRMAHISNHQPTQYRIPYTMGTPTAVKKVRDLSEGEWFAALGAWNPMDVQRPTVGRLGFNQHGRACVKTPKGDMYLPVEEDFADLHLVLAMQLEEEPEVFTG